MSKARSKGPLIPVRLSLTADAEIRRKAQAKGLSPGLYVAALLERSLTPDTGKPLHRQEVGGSVTGVVTPLAQKRAARRDESNNSTIHHPSVGPGAGACPHKHRQPIGAGLFRCESCGLTKGIDGSWR